MINNPSLFDPGADEDNMPRAHGALHATCSHSMAETGAITTAEAASTPRTCPSSRDARPTSATADRRASCSRWSSGSWSRPASTPRQISGGGLKITTTFDKKAQNAAVEAAQKYTRQAAEAADKKASDLHAAVASVEVGHR